MELSDLLPIPELEKCRKLLCIQPHPDDNEIGAGGTIAKLVKLGCEVTYLTVTDGSIGTLDAGVNRADLAALRQKEARLAANLLGVGTNLFLELEDGSYPDEQELTRRIVGVIRAVEPDIVMTVDPFLPYEGHPDHRKVGMATVEACLFSVFPHFTAFEDSEPVKPWNVQGIAFYNTAYPNTFINVDDSWELKLKAIAAHFSQFSGAELEKYKMYFEFKSRQYAEGRGFTHAEALKVLDPMHLHVNVDTIHC